MNGDTNSPAADAELAAQWAAERCPVIDGMCPFREARSQGFRVRAVLSRPIPITLSRTSSTTSRVMCRGSRSLPRGPAVW
jgi:hypothetical protein